ncbi:MAG: hypothetical protein AAF938_30150, partial [Myxococcota bacterium]
FSGAADLNVVFTRNCEGVVCADGEICIDAQCVNEDCDPTNPVGCRSGLCVIDGDCDGTAVSSCAERQCINSICLGVGDDDACDEDELCNIDTGCQTTLPDPSDAGLDMSGCGMACDTGEDCTTGILECTGVAECIAEPAPAGTSCTVEGAAGSCDSSGGCVVGCIEGASCELDNPCEAGVTRCESGSETCEPSGPAPATVVCRESAGVCDVAETCDGVSTECPDDGFQSGDTCREAAGVCDVAERCAGDSAVCPDDGFVVAGSACTGGFCNGLAAECQSGCVPGSDCDTGNGCEIGQFDCSGPEPVCRAVANRPDGTSCGSTILGTFGACDYRDTCDEAATRTRTNTRRECSVGVCTNVPEAESEACTRNRSGVSCGSTSCGGFGSCGGFSGTCDTTGTQSRTCTDRRCGGGSCQNQNRNETQSCTRTLTETCGDLTDNDCDGQCDEGCRVPVHRGLRGADHRWARTTAELTVAGYTIEGVSFYLYDTQIPGTVPYYSCRARTIVDHFMSPSSNCEGQLVVGLLGYVRSASSPACGSTSLFRMFWPGRDHLYTTSTAERASALAGPYDDEGVNAQVWSRP